MSMTDALGPPQVGHQHSYHDGEAGSQIAYLATMRLFILRSRFKKCYDKARCLRLP
jgi:hypothetical protein